MILSENIQKYRKQRGWSQEELAVKLSVTRQSISKWELGEAVPEINKIIQMADIFEVSLDDLTGHSSKQHNQKPKHYRTFLFCAVTFLLGLGLAALLNVNKTVVNVNDFKNIIDHAEVEKVGSRTVKLSLTPKLYREDIQYTLLVDNVEYPLTYENYQLNASMGLLAHQDHLFVLRCQMKDLSFQEFIAKLNFDENTLYCEWHYQDQ